jgi:hypothetical protein
MEPPLKYLLPRTLMLKCLEPLDTKSPREKLRTSNEEKNEPEKNLNMTIRTIIKTKEEYY